MMATNYARGRAKEYHVMAQLKKQGYTCIRAAGSKGAYDVIAWTEDGPCRCIQVKREERASNQTYPPERALLFQAPCPVGGRRELWVWSDNLKAWRAQMLITGEKEFEYLHHIPVSKKPRGRAAKTEVSKPPARKKTLKGGTMSHAALQT